MLKEATVGEFYEWKQLLKYPEWQRYVDILKENEKRLQREANTCIRNKDFHGATKFLAQKDLIPKLLGKVKDRIGSCKDQKKE